MEKTQSLAVRGRSGGQLDRTIAFRGDAEEKRRYVRQMFGRIAARYDLMNTVMTAGRHHAWRRLVARLADPAPGLPALDLCCGTGDQALALAELGRGPVVAVDFAAPMLTLARVKAERRGLAHRLSLHLADALCLPFPDDTFSCATTAFALRNVADLTAFLAEMRRVVRPGGRVVTLDLLGPPSGALAPLGRLYLEHVVPWLGGLLVGDRDAYSYLPASTGFVPTAEGLAEAFRQAGLQGVGWRLFAFGSVAVHWGTVP